MAGIFFSCTFCKELHKDKNMTSYHRIFNLCKVYKEPVALKMYPLEESLSITTGRCDLAIATHARKMHKKISI
jgi:hypothetical protein